MLLLLPLFSAFLYIYSFPFNFSGYLIYIAFIPLLFALCITSKKLHAFYSGSLFAVPVSIYFSIPLFHSLTLASNSQIFYPCTLIFLTAVLPLSVIYGLFGIAANHALRSNRFTCLLLVPSYWVLIDYLREILPFSIPWGFAGYTQVYTPLIQISDLTGIHGVTFIILLFNTATADTLSSLYKKKSYKLHEHSKNNKLPEQKIIPGGIIAILIFSTCISYGVIKKKIIMQYTVNGEKASFLLIQGNTDSVERWNELSSTARYQEYISLTKKSNAKTDFVIWPETVLNSSDKVNYDIMSGVSAFLAPSSYFVTGGIRKDSRGNTYNSIFVLNNSELKYIYDKKILFPYSERPFFGKSAGQFLNSPEKFTPGMRGSVFNIQNRLTGFTICFESLYSGEIRKLSKRGASILINVANDSWFGEGSVPNLQIYALIARAVENRINIIRAANTGISAVIAPSGDIISEIPLNTQNTLQSEIKLLSFKTVYSKAGDWIIILSVLIILFSIIRDELKIRSVDV